MIQDKVYRAIAEKQREKFDFEMRENMKEAAALLLLGVLGLLIMKLLGLE